MRTLVQNVKFDLPPRELYELFLDSKKHSEATGGKAVMSRKVGGRYSAWDGYIKGKNLVLEPGRLITQTWRNPEFKKGDPDSILSLCFAKKGKGTRLTLIHAVVPDHLAADLKKGWPRFYWKPIAKYLKKKK